MMMEAAMHHPVCLAFYMEHLDPEDKSAVRRWSARIAVVCSSLALLLVAALTLGILIPQDDAVERAGVMGVPQVARVAGMPGAPEALRPGAR
jgi:hypothetical protein